MKRSTYLTAVFIILLACVSIASAAGPELGGFATTGYTTYANIEPLPNGYLKFHIAAQGEPGGANDAFCQAAYGVPCDYVCLGFTGKPCGVDGALAGGAFTFSEWGLGDPLSLAGFNHGLLTITTGADTANLRFGGEAAETAGVAGSFMFLDGSGEYKKLKGGGVYSGNAGYVFTVDYTPCGGKGEEPCPANRCAVFGDDLAIKKDKIEWQISNEGEAVITASQVDLVWPVASGPITRVKLGGKTIYEGALNPPTATIDLSTWIGKDKELQIGAGQKNEKLTLEFAKQSADISPNPWDYTILVKFAEGCGVPFVAFAP